jgi:hypothetical protein
MTAEDIMESIQHTTKTIEHRLAIWPSLTTLMDVAVSSGRHKDETNKCNHFCYFMQPQNRKMLNKYFVFK